MDGRAYRYGTRAKLRDVFVCLLISVAGGAAGAVMARRDHQGFLAGWGAAFLAATFTVLRWRWGRWAGADEKGLFAGNAKGDPVHRLGWDEMEELVLFRVGGFEARGGGAAVRAGADLDGVEHFRDAVLRVRAPALFRKLRRRFNMGEALEFSGVRTPGAAFLRGAALFCFLWAPLCAPFFFLGQGAGLALLAVIGLGTLARETLACARITLDPRGIVLRTLVTRVFPWEDLDAAWLLPRGHLAIRPRGGRPIEISPDLGNFIILQELVLERLGRR